MNAVAPRFSLGMRVGAALWSASMLSVGAVLPFALALQRTAIADAAAKSGLTPGQLIALSLVQSALVLALLIAAGTWAAGRLALRAPIVEALVGRTPLPSLRALGPAALVGVVGGIVMVGLDVAVFLGLSPELKSLGAAVPSPWQGFLASFYGGIGEEVQLRWCVLSLLAVAFVWGWSRLARAPQAGLTPAVFWSANVLAAVLFGLGHLPATAALVPLTGALVVRAVVLNAVVAIPCGWLFWRRGLEAAMVAHFSADLVVHVLIPLLRPAA